MFHEKLHNLGMEHIALDGGRPSAPQYGLDLVYKWEFDCFGSFTPHFFDKDYAQP